MKQHEPAAEGQTVTIEVCDNGYELTYQYSYKTHKKVFTTFNSLVDFVAYVFCLKGIMPEVKVVEVDPS